MRDGEVLHSGMHVKFASLRVSNQDRAIEFYTKHFGMSVSKDARYSGDWRWIELALPGAQTNLLLEMRNNSDPSSSPDLAIAVEGLLERFQSMEKNGVEFLGEPETASWNPNELSVLFRDSEGNLVLLSEQINSR